MAIESVREGAALPPEKQSFMKGKALATAMAMEVGSDEEDSRYTEVPLLAQLREFGLYDLAAKRPQAAKVVAFERSVGGAL